MEQGSNEAQQLKKLLLTILCLIVFVNPTFGSSGFVSKKGNLSKEFAVDNPREKIILIYNHGSGEEWDKDNCYPEKLDYIWPKYGGTPSILANLSGETILGKIVLVYAFCSNEFRGNPDLPAPSPGVSKQEKRQKAILGTVEKFLALGVPPNQIFLTGYSAGGWAALTLAATAGEKFNAAIAFSPAFAGKWRSRSEGWEAFRAVQIDRIKSPANLQALVFAHPNDSFETPESLVFLKEFEGVEFIELPRNPKRLGGKWCYYANITWRIRDGHDIYQASCFQIYAPRIVDYIQRRLKAAGD